MSDAPIGVHRGGPPETILDPEPADVLEAIEAARRSSDPRAALAEVLAAAPASLEAWSRLGELARDPIEAYAAYRVGYHRGLDRLRQSGWRGSGYVRWEHPANRGFLRSLAGLQATATGIGEIDESERCAHFLRQLDPGWPPEELT